MKNKVIQEDVAIKGFVSSDKITKSEFHDFKYSFSQNRFKKNREEYSKGLEFIVDWYQIRD